jgi:hypothetical protein
MAQLQHQLQASKLELERVKTRMETARTSQVDNDKDSSSVSIANESNRDEPTWMHIERQQGEVSRHIGWTADRCLSHVALVSRARNRLVQTIHRTMWP